MEDANGKVPPSCPYNEEHKVKLLLGRKLGQGGGSVRTSLSPIPLTRYVVSHDI